MKKRMCTFGVAKTKVLISCAVTSQLICGFVFAKKKIRFSHGAAHIYPLIPHCYIVKLGSTGVQLYTFLSYF